MPKIDANLRGSEELVSGGQVLANRRGWQWDLLEMQVSFFRLMLITDYQTSWTKYIQPSAQKIVDQVLVIVMRMFMVTLQCLKIYLTCSSKELMCFYHWNRMFIQSNGFSDEVLIFNAVLFKIQTSLWVWKGDWLGAKLTILYWRRHCCWSSCRR